MDETRAGVHRALALFGDVPSSLPQKVDLQVCAPTINELSNAGRAIDAINECEVELARRHRALVEADRVLYGVIREVDQSVVLGRQKLLAIQHEVEAMAAWLAGEDAAGCLDLVVVSFLQAKIRELKRVTDETARHSASAAAVISGLDWSGESGSAANSGVAGWDVEPAAAEQRPTVNRVQDALVWIDCQTTGLDPRTDLLLEIAIVVTDADLNVVGDGVAVVIHADEAALSSMSDAVAQMHERSGLLDEVRASTLDVAAAETIVLDYIGEHVEPGTAPLAGNLVAFDPAFLVRDMPALEAFLHDRRIDVSSVKELGRRWYPEVYGDAPGKDLAHRALAEIHESIRELRFYRQTMFRPANPWGQATT